MVISAIIFTLFCSFLILKTFIFELWYYINVSWWFVRRSLLMKFILPITLFKHPQTMSKVKFYYLWTISAFMPVSLLPFYVIMCWYINVVLPLSLNLPPSCYRCFVCTSILFFDVDIVLVLNISEVLWNNFIDLSSTK